MLSEIINGTYNYDQYLFFIVLNSMGEPYNKVLNAYNDVKNCESKNLNDLNTIKNYVIIIGIVVLCCGFLSLAIYLIIIDKYLNLIWEILRTRIRNSFFQLRKNIENRISQIHEKIDFGNDDFDVDTLKNKQILNYRHSFKTIIRFSIIFIIALC